MSYRIKIEEKSLLVSSTCFHNRLNGFPKSWSRKIDTVTVTVPSFEWVCNFAQDIASEIYVREGHGAYRKWAIGEAVHNGSRAKTYVLLKNADGSTCIEKAEKYDVIYNPYLKRIVYNTNIHGQMVSWPYEHGKNSYKPVRGDYWLMTVLMECVGEGKYAVEIPGDNQAKYIIIGKQLKDKIVLQDGRIFSPKRELKCSRRIISYYEVAWVFNPDDILII